MLFNKTPYHVHFRGVSSVLKVNIYFVLYLIRYIILQDFYAKI